MIDLTNLLIRALLWRNDPVRDRRTVAQILATKQGVALTNLITAAEAARKDYDDYIRGDVNPKMEALAYALDDVEKTQ